MRSFRPPRSNGLSSLGSATPVTSPLAPPEEVPVRPRTPTPEPVVAPAPAPAPAPMASMDCTPLLTGLLRGRQAGAATVAIICGDEMLLERLRRDLEEDGCTVVAADSGPTLIPQLVGCTPSLLLVHEDVVDPEPLELACTLRDDPELAEVELVLMSARSSVDARRVAFHAGAVDLLQLPYLRSELRSRIMLRVELNRFRQHPAAGALQRLGAVGA
jgi:CheY-like chemotaxis protein